MWSHPSSWFSLPISSMYIAMLGFDLWVRKIPWRREQQPTPVFLPGKFHGQRSPWGCKDLDVAEQLMKKWCFWTVVLENTLESPLDCKEIQSVHPKRRSVLSVHWKDWCWSWNSNTLATWREELTHLKRLWYWERLKAGEEGDDRGWDGWMASPTQWRWVWVNSGSWLWTGRLGVLQSMESAKNRTQLSDWTELSN